MCAARMGRCDRLSSFCVARRQLDVAGQQSGRLDLRTRLRQADHSAEIASNQQSTILLGQAWIWAKLVGYPGYINISEPVGDQTREVSFQWAADIIPGSTYLNGMNFTFTALLPRLPLARQPSPLSLSLSISLSLSRLPHTYCLGSSIS